MSTVLDDSNLLSSLAYRPCLLIHRMDVTFRFSLSGMDGHWVISLDFPDFNNGYNQDSEIELRIKKINFDDPRRSLDKSEAKQTTFKEFRFEKIETCKLFIGSHG